MGRSKLLKSVSYTLNLVLPKGTTFVGSVDIDFELVATGPLFLDYSGKEVGDIVINGERPVASTLFSGHRLRIPEELQETGRNNVAWTSMGR